MSNIATNPSPSQGGRPLGVTILSLLFVWGGIGLVVTNVSSISGGSYGVGVFIGFITSINGWGMWKGKGWAWNLFIITTLFGLIFAFLGFLEGLSLYLAYFAIFGLAFDTLTIYYMTRKAPMAYFGKTSLMDEFF